MGRETKDSTGSHALVVGSAGDVGSRFRAD